MDDKGWCIWFTGLPCSGKTTLARALGKYLQGIDIDYFHLDGDVTRKTISKDLGFSAEDRDANINRILGIATFIAEEGENSICSYISPYATLRNKVPELIEKSLIIYVEATAEVCAKRDVKGMWAKAKAGEITGFTGHDDPYEIPYHPDLVVKTEHWDIPFCTASIVALMEARGLLSES